MRSIDIHAHMIPGTLWKAVDSKQEWHGFRHEPGEGDGAMVGGGMRNQFTSPKLRFTVEQRIRISARFSAASSPMIRLDVRSTYSGVTEVFVEGPEFLHLVDEFPTFSGRIPSAGYV